MVERLREAGTLSNCIAVCDVSGSMGSLMVSPGEKITQSDVVEPIFNSVALSLLLAQLAEPPFSNCFITFHEDPSIVKLSSAPDAGLIDFAREMERAPWGGSTDFEAVFLQLLLPMAIEHKLKKEDMVKRIFVFSDMQFNEAKSGGTPWETNHQRIVKAFGEAGYDVPEIVYWNLAGRVAAKPVTKDTPGVAMVSGFSGNLLKVFMDDEELKEEEWSKVEEDGAEEEKAEKKSMTPEEIMQKALGKKSFDGLKVLD